MRKESGLSGLEQVDTSNTVLESLSLVTTWTSDGLWLEEFEYEEPRTWEKSSKNVNPWVWNKLSRKNKIKRMWH